MKLKIRMELKASWPGPWLVFWSPGYTQRVVHAVRAEGEDELWQGAGRAQDAEQGQHQVPRHQWPPQVEGLPATPCIL